jgi:hypothetical protein
LKLLAGSASGSVSVYVLAGKIHVFSFLGNPRKLLFCLGLSVNLQFILMCAEGIAETRRKKSMNPQNLTDVHCRKCNKFLEQLRIGYFAYCSVCKCATMATGKPAKISDAKCC